MCKHSGMGMNRCVWGPRLTFMISSSAHHLYFWRQGFSLVLSSCTELDCLANELQGSTCVYSPGVGLQELPTTSRSPSFLCGAEDTRSLCTNWAISPALYSYVIAKMHDRSSVKAAHKHTPLVHSGKAVKWKKNEKSDGGSFIVFHGSDQWASCHQGGKNSLRMFASAPVSGCLPWFSLMMSCHL